MGGGRLWKPREPAQVEGRLRIFGGGQFPQQRWADLDPDPSQHPRRGLRRPHGTRGVARTQTAAAGPDLGLTTRTNHDTTSASGTETRMHKYTCQHKDRYKHMPTHTHTNKQTD